jgi:hypothetical protein
MRRGAGSAFEEDLGDGAGSAEPADSPFSEADAMELGAALLAAAEGGGLERFLGALLGRAGIAAGTPLARALGGGLASAVGAVLAPSGRGVPEIARGAEGSLGLALEGLSAEDREFEIAQRIIHFLGAAIARAAASPPATPPLRAARSAIAAAAHAFAPGLGPTPGAGEPAGGDWVRRGGRIVVRGA